MARCQEHDHDASLLPCHGFLAASRGAPGVERGNEVECE